LDICSFSFLPPNQKKKFIQKTKTPLSIIPKKMSSTANSCSNNKWNTVAVDALAASIPNAITAALTSANVQACYLSPVGECTQSGCDLQKKSNATLDCRCLTFFANMNAGVYNGMNCLLSSTNASTTVNVVSEQNIVINIISSGDISNVAINNNQAQNVQVTTLTLSDTQNQQSLANIATDSIKAILYDAGINPGLYSDNVSTQLIKAFQQYLAANPDGLNNIVDNKTVSTLSQLTQVNNTGSNDININIIDSTWAHLKLDLNQATVISLLAESIATNVCKAVTNGVLADTVNSALANIVTVCAGAPIPSGTPKTSTVAPAPAGATMNTASPSPNTAGMTANTAPASTMGPTSNGGSHSTIMIVIIIIVLIIIGIFLYFVWGRKKKQTQLVPQKQKQKQQKQKQKP